MVRSRTLTHGVYSFIDVVAHRNSGIESLHISIAETKAGKEHHGRTPRFHEHNKNVEATARSAVPSQTVLLCSRLSGMSWPDA